MKVVVGLRNPGSDYAGTRHNIGAEVLAEVARRAGERFKAKTMRTRSEVAETRIDGEKVLLAAPLSFMNESGGPVSATLRYVKAEVSDLLVIHDDIDLDFGRLRVQVGGGIRTADDVAFYLDQGVDRVILGSVAVNDPAFTKEMLATYGGERIAIGLDARDGYVATEGWLETSSVKAETLAQELARFGAEVFIFTDISRDGMLSGPNTEAITALAEATGKQVIASGGVSSLADLSELRQRTTRGVSGAIVGKALYTNQFTLAEALKGDD